MTKVQIWSNVLEIGERYELSEEAMNELSTLLKPKTRGSNRPEPIIIDDETYYYCRYTNRYWTSENMIYQNDEKRINLQDKGYSKIGISLWTRGRKIVEGYKDELTQQILSLDPDVSKIEELKENLRTADFNNYQWLLNKIMTEEDEATILSYSIEKS